MKTEWAVLFNEDVYVYLINHRIRDYLLHASFSLCNCLQKYSRSCNIFYVV